MAKFTVLLFALLVALPACGGEDEAKTPDKPAKPAKPETPPVEPPAEPETSTEPETTEPEAPAADAMAKAKEMVGKLTQMVKDGDMEGAKKLLGELQAMDLTAELKKQVDDAAKMIKAKDAAGSLGFGK